jgi:hypothetical protein
MFSCNQRYQLKSHLLKARFTLSKLLFNSPPLLLKLFSSRTLPNLSKAGFLEDSKKEALDLEQEEKKTCSLVDKHFAEAKKYRENFEEEWKECEEFYNGNHWKDKNRTFKNLIFPIIEQEAAVLVENLPGIDVLARKEELEDAAKVLESAIHFTLENQNAVLKDVMSIKAALKTGNGFQYVDFDPDAENGQGSVVLKVVPWKHVYIDPAAIDLDEASFVGIKFPTRTAEVKRRFPQFADKIKANKSSENDGSSFGMRENRDNQRDGGSTEDRYKLDDMCTLEEAWLRDYSMVKIPEEETAAEIEKETEEFFNDINPDISRFEDHAAHIEAHEAQKQAIINEALMSMGIDASMVTENDLENLKAEVPELALKLEIIDDHIRIHQQYYELNPNGEKPKFNSSLRLVIKVGSTILYDGQAPVDDGLVPLVPYYGYKDEESVYGFGEVKNLLASQKSFNEMDNAEYESLHLTSNPGWVMDADAGINPQTITNKRGLVFVKNKNAEFKRLEPGQTSPQLMQRKISDQQFINDISGMNNASQGKAEGGVTAARAFERLQQTSNGRIRLKATQLHLYSIPRKGKLIASRIVKYWTTERLLRVTDSSTGQVQTVKFDPEMIKDLEYDIRVAQGELAGIDKEAMYDLMSTYVDKGWLTPKSFFQIVDVPNKRKILEELEKNDQQVAMLEQLAIENEQLKAQLGLVPPPEQGSSEMAPAMAPAEQPINSTGVM